MRMNINDLVCDFELAERLKELGIKQNSYFVYYKFKIEKRYNSDVTENWQIDDDERFDTISAFTANELMEYFPAFIEDRETGHDTFNALMIGKGNRMVGSFYTANYTCNDTNFQDESLANVCAKLLIWLIEEKYISV